MHSPQLCNEMYFPSTLSRNQPKGGQHPFAGDIQCGRAAAIYEDMSVSERAGYSVSSQAVTAGLPCDEFRKTGSGSLHVLLKLHLNILQIVLNTIETDMHFVLFIYVMSLSAALGTIYKM